MRIERGLAKSHAEAKTALANMHHLEVPPLYTLDQTQWRLADRYLDETFQWVMLVDGRRVRTRRFKQEWEDYIPLDFKQRAKSDGDYSFTKHATMTRVLSADHHCKHRVGTLKLWCEGKVAYIEHDVHDTVSLLTVEVTTPDLLKALVDILRKYQIACRYFSKAHDLNVKIFLRAVTHFHQLTQTILPELKQTS